MNIRKTIAVVLIVAVAFAALFGVAAYSRANAQASTPTAPSGEVPAEKNGLRHEFGRGFGGGIANEDLANALGITVDELSAAYQTAHDAALAKAVEAGLITQAQADELIARGTVFPFGGRWGGWLVENGIDLNALLADALGISVEKLQNARLEAYNTRIDQAVADGNLTHEQADLMKGHYALSNSESFQTAMQSAFDAAVKQAVTDGVITQAQADQILQNSQGMKFFGFGGGPGGRGGHGGFGRHGEWGEPGLPAVPSTAPSTGTSGT